jgi:hypothetical protein
LEVNIIEPKTWDEYWQEGLKDYKGDYSCKFIGETNWKWVANSDLSEIEIHSNCNLDHHKSECQGKCSRYIKKTILQRLWDKFIHQKLSTIMIEFFGLLIVLLILW